MRYDNVNEVFESLIDAYYNLRDVEAILACVTDDIEWIGTEKNECAKGKEDLRKLLKEDTQMFPDSFGIEMNEPTLQMLRESVAIIRVDGKQLGVAGLIASINIRATVICLKTEDGWLVNHVHTSVANSEKEKYLLAKELDDNRKKEQLLLAGIPGGVAMYRLKKDGSVYTEFVSDGFAKMSGYDNSSEFCEILRKNAFVHVYEEDVKEILNAAKKSATDRTPISIMYHAYKKNGDVFLQRMDANVMDLELAEDDLAVWYAVHTVVSESAKRIIKEQKELHELMDDVPTGIGVYEVIDGKVVQNYVNDAFYRMLGSNRESRTKYFGENTMDAVHPDDKFKIQDVVKLAMAGEDSINVDYRLEIENGEWFWVHLVGSVVERKENYIRIYAAISDYNQIKKREQQYEEQLRISNVATKDALSKVYLNLSKKTVISLEHTAEEYTAHESIHDADELFASIKRDITDENEFKKFECVSSCNTIIEGYKNGITHYEITTHLSDTRWTKAIYDVLENVYTGDIELISSIHDVTDQMRSDLVIHKLMDIAYKSILLVDNQTGIAIPYKRDENDNNIDEINAGMEQTRSQQEGLEEFFRAHALPEKVEDVIKANSPETIKKMLEIYPYYECMYALMENGELSQYKVTYAYLEDDRRILMSAVQDVTKVYEKEMQQSNKLEIALAEAEAANQAKTAFLSRISHDMRTPLNGILGLTTLMKDTVTDNDVLRDLNQMENSGNYLLNLINDTLDMSKIESGKFELHPIVSEGKTFFNDAMELARINIESKKIYYHIHADELPFTILYDDIARLEQVIMNVVSNAVKFTPEGGTIDIAVKNIAIEGRVITDQIIVKDSGIGMSPEFLPHIFEAFSQEDSSRTTNATGTGLGMSITKQLLHLMGGDISVESELGKGTCVTITMKLHIATETQIEEWKKNMDSLDYGMDLSGKRILLCEDHPLNAQIVKRLLEVKDMIVEHAENGQIGLDMFRHSVSGYYDAVLMDIRMPVMDGIDTAKAIRNLPRRDARMIPIIAMTANAFKEDVEETKNAGMDAHLSKPIEKDVLYHTLASLMKVDSISRKQKILVVDDVDVNRAVIRASLEEDYEIVEALNGKEALEIMNNSKGIDVVITDIQMPEMDGIELVRQLRSNPRNRHLVILANTQFGDQEQEEVLLELGANDFIYKPTTSKIVEVRVRNALRRM